MKKANLKLFLKKVDGLKSRIDKIEEETGVKCRIILLTTNKDLWDNFDVAKNPGDNMPYNYHIRTGNGLVDVLPAWYHSKERNTIYKIMELVGMHREIVLGKPKRKK